MIRELVALSPPMYRQVVALCIHRNRPGLDVRAATREVAGREIAGFHPRLLVHNDTAPIPEGALAGVPCRVEVLYSDSMNAQVRADGTVSEAYDMSTEDLLRAVDGTAELAGRASRGRSRPGVPRWFLLDLLYGEPVPHERLPHRRSEGRVP